MCPLSIIRCALSPFVHVFTLPGVYVAMCSHCFVFSLSCVSVVCV